MTTYHQTNPLTGELLSGPHEARVDPRSGQPLIPRGGVTTAPPSVDPGEVAVWSGGQWVATEDHRGETGFVAGQQMTIRDLGPLPEGWTTEPPEEPAPDGPPATVTPRQIRLALLGIGITPQMIEAELAGDAAAVVEWEYASFVARDHPLVAALAAALSLSPAQVDSLFLAAADL